MLLSSWQNLLIVIHLQQIICDSIQFSIPEEQQPGTLAGSLGEHFPPPYQLLTPEFLWMEKTTGDLYTTERRLDREALCPEETEAERCIILLTAAVGPSGDLIQFPVIIEDINDNVPHFEKSKIHLWVSEDAPVGTSLLLDVQAVDRDAGHNGEVHYRLQDPDGVFSLTLRQDGPVVSLVVQTALDRETRDFYELKLEAADRGSEPLSTTATLMVTVTDVDDNCPSFSAGGPGRVTIPGGSPGNTLVAQVRATDPDSAPNAATIYSLSPKVSERAKKLFILDSLTGDIRLAQDLQSDSSEELLLKVLASSQRCPPADTLVTVAVLPEANRELTIKIAFIGEHQKGAMVLPENQSPTALAILELEGDSSFTSSSLAIENKVPFSLSPQNGKYLLSTSKPLDHETKSDYSVCVVAQATSAAGSALAPSRHVFRVRVADVNDNAPNFLQSHYQLEVEENNLPGRTLLHVSASDVDSGRNGRVSYRLGNHTPTAFSVHPATGRLSASASLDREVQRAHVITVLARDSGSPPLESVATVSVRVLDQNDNAPVFLKSHFIFFVPEDAPVFAEVGAIGVSDPDEGENGNTELFFENDGGAFLVDSTQGILHTAARLDHETEQRYDLDLLACDRGSPSTLTSSTRVTIFVVDVNDNPPKVILPISNSSCLTVPTDTTRGTVVAKIHAIDEDSGLNSQLTYTVLALEPAPSSAAFKVDSRSGNITVAEELLQKDLGMHHLFIVVRDGGSPTPLYTTVWVNLFVSDSSQPCLLAGAPMLTGTFDFVQKPSTAPVCEAESIKRPQLMLLAGLGMALASLCLFVATAVLYLKSKRGSARPNKGGCMDDKAIPLRFKSRFHFDG